MVRPQTLITTSRTLFPKDELEQHTLMEVLEGIKSKDNKFQYIIKEIAKAPHTQANIMKLALPPIYFAGTFIRKEDSGLDKYSQLVCLDVDDVSDISAFKKEIKAFPYVYSCFRSPSGKGLKILVFHDYADPKRHPDIYWHIGRELGLLSRTDLTFDTHCSNISRACFFSYDPNLLINPNAKTMKIDEVSLPTLPVSSKTGGTSSHDTLTPVPPLALPSNYHDLKQLKDLLVKELEEFERFHSFYPGVRNTNLNILTCKLRSKGCPLQIVLPYLQLYYGGRHPDFSTKEIESCVRSVYTHCP